ncbi:FHA domain-containing protein [Pleurocapsa sp. FMAR1]|uniref:FHA domain-containing protein n=1 Tax=Pleurocapsa sp. FMAR1 TaxID=3040204 RepID=UPI0029C63D8A|nr:FHA domain-containing protein [Pleurocapsa sp. FMAR1]
MSVTNIKSSGYEQAGFTFKITALNAETCEFKEKLLTLTTGMPRNYLIGRHSSCDLVLNSAEVSRVHGRICFEDGQCFYTDFGSTDGSQIDE